MKAPRRRRRSAKPIFAWLVVVLLTVLVFCGADKRLNTMVEEIAANSAREYSVNAINSCVDNVLSASGTDYADLISITVPDGGGTAILRADITAINTLKARLTSAIQQRLSEYSDDEIRVPLGNLSGSELFTGKGPGLRVQLIPVGYVSSGIENEFIGAGINQTLHRIILKVSANVTVVMAGRSAQTEIDTDFCISETIVVGAVPEAFTEVNEAQDRNSSIYDFGATAP